MSLLAPEAVASRLGISPHTARRLMSTGVIPSENIGAGARGQWRTTEAYVNDWLSSFGGKRLPKSAAVTETEASALLRVIPSTRGKGRKTGTR